MEDVTDENGTRWRAVELRVDGGLAVVGHDLDRGVGRAFGSSEYEFERRLTPADVSTLRRVLAVAADGDLLAAIGARFASSRDLEDFLAEHHVAGTFWSRVGD